MRNALCQNRFTYAEISYQGIDISRLCLASKFFSECKRLLRRIGFYTNFSFLFFHFISSTLFFQFQTEFFQFLFCDSAKHIILLSDLCSRDNISIDTIAVYKNLFVV